MLFQLPLLKGQSYLALLVKVLLMLHEAKGSRYFKFQVKEMVDEYYLTIVIFYISVSYNFWITTKQPYPTKWNWLYRSYDVIDLS